MLPFVLIAARQWRVIVAGAATVLMFSLASLAAFGMETWSAFLGGSGNAIMMMETSDIGFGRMIMSFFGAVTMLNGPLSLAYGAQAVCALMVISAASYLAYTIRDMDVIAPLIAGGTVLITPFLLAYDLTLLAIPLVWLYRQIQIGGELPGERIIMILGFAIPGLANILARELWLPLAPFIAAGVFFCVARRAMHESSTATFEHNQAASN